MQCSVLRDSVLLSFNKDVPCVHVHAYASATLYIAWLLEFGKCMDESGPLLSYLSEPVDVLFLVSDLFFPF
jgi:hypothetical protein